MINMDDVAVKAKVSKATVSRVLNGKKLVSPNAREKVLAACRELDYKLNHNIQDLILKSRNGATRNIAFVIVDKEFADPAYAHLVDGISEAVNAAHYHLLLVKLTGNENNVFDLPPILRDERVDGILLTGELVRNTVELVKKLDSKCVVMGNYSERLLSGLGSVQNKVENQIYSLIDDLAKAGKKRIAFVEECPDNFVSAKLFAAYREGLAEHGLKYDRNICYFGNGPFSGMFDALLPLMREDTLPFDSMICPDIRIAREVSHLLFGHFGLKQPVSVMLGTFRQFGYFKLPVPTVFADANIRNYCTSALEHLINQIEKQEAPRTILID